MENLLLSSSAQDRASGISRLVAEHTQMRDQLDAMRRERTPLEEQVARLKRECEYLKRQLNSCNRPCDRSAGDNSSSLYGGDYEEGDDDVFKKSVGPTPPQRRQSSAVS